MFNTFQNHVRIDFTLVPDGPVLVRSGEVSLDPAIAEMEFQRTVHQGRRTVFLAGSGLKGALRSHCERLLSSYGGYACDPTLQKVKDSRGKWVANLEMCGHRDLKRGEPPRYPHANQCAACFTFGSLKLSGRFRVADAFPREDLWEETNATEARMQVGLDRKSQGPAHGALFDCELVVGGGFAATVSGESFSLWQLGLVLQALDDLDAGLTRIGGCKARGMGTVKVEAPSVELRFADCEEGWLTGARKSREDRHDYGLPEDDRLAVEDCWVEGRSGLFRTVRVGSEAVPALRNKLVESSLLPYLSRSR